MSANPAPERMGIVIGAVEKWHARGTRTLYPVDRSQDLLSLRKDYSR
jgi:hypothetical protein